MPGWEDEYRANLQTVAHASSQNRELIDHCSHLSDRVSALEAEKAVLLAELHTHRDTAPPSEPAADSNGSDSAITARLRLELAEALRAKGTFETRLRAADEELVRLRSKTGGDTKTIDALTADRKALARKLRDREEELVAKKKLVADVQDELSVLHLQLNIMEKKHAEKVSENKQLVMRYMQRVGQEADEMNEASEAFFSKKK
ncbi:autophagy protein 16 [Thozetella sp. PMI_491]|nr:autophagy protein 16 [Thozetella sp. PMI_491]